MLMPGRRFSNSTYRYGFNGKENDNDIKGEGNEQDYGMRIYDSRIGKFLSVDPFTPKFPWYTPYQFAGNKPILFIDIDGLEEADISKKYLPYAQDMSQVPLTYKGASGRVVQTTYNLHGYGVNNLYFWENNIRLHPEFLDEWNKGRVLVEGKSPIFTNELKLKFESNGISTEGLKIGDLLEHHHINQGRTAIPITRSEHDQIPVQKSNSGVSIASRPGKVLRRFVNSSSMLLSPAIEIIGFLNNNPDAMINQFGKQNDIGIVYKNSESNLYFTIVSQKKGETEGTNYFIIYSSYEWDEKLGKYVGVNPVGYGEQYDQKEGYSRTIIYNLDGKVKSMNEKGRKSENSMQ